MNRVLCLRQVIREKHLLEGLQAALSLLPDVLLDFGKVHRQRLLQGLQAGFDDLPRLSLDGLGELRHARLGASGRSPGHVGEACEQQLQSVAIGVGVLLELAAPGPLCDHAFLDAKDMDRKPQRQAQEIDEVDFEWRWRRVSKQVAHKTTSLQGRGSRRNG